MEINKRFNLRKSKNAGERSKSTYSVKCVGTALAG